MKIFVVYDSSFSTNEKIAHQIGQKLGETHETTVRHIHNIKPSDLIKENVDVLIVGGPIRMGNLSISLKSWIHTLSIKLQTRSKKIPFVAFFTTHMIDRQYREKWMDLYNDHQFAEKLYPELLSLRVKEMKGPLLDSEPPKIDAFLEKIQTFLK